MHISKNLIESKNLIQIQNLLNAKIHIGHSKRSLSSQMIPYLYGIRNNICIIDLQKTIYLLKRALQLVKEVSALNGTILFVGSFYNKKIQSLITNYADKCNQPSIGIDRWIGGTITNRIDLYSKHLSNMYNYENWLNQLILQNDFLDEERSNTITSNSLKIKHCDFVSEGDLRTKPPSK